jgi:hypothetical protein
MGNTTSYTVVTPIIYNCPSCMESGKVPNNIDSFYINNLNQCQCNGCGSIINNLDIYKFVDKTNT